MATSAEPDAPKVDYALLQKAAAEILIAIGEDLNREGLLDTPRRFADMWREFAEYDPGNHETIFESVKANQMVVVSGMRVWSMCEHHLLPFWCDIAVGYITHEKVMGLSKFGRIAQKHAHALQLQERLVADIAQDVILIAQTPDVAVLGRGEHLCMSMRGIKMPALMTSSSLHGSFAKPEVRAEFLSLALAK
jgi:GTP cyclohydrolase I